MKDLQSDTSGGKEALHLLPLSLNDEYMPNTTKDGKGCLVECSMCKCVDVDQAGE